MPHFSGDGKVSEKKTDVRFKHPSFGDFPGGPVVRTLHFHCRGSRFNPWLGN